MKAELKDKNVFSVSRINLYLQNPFKHWAKYTEGLREKHSPERHRFMDCGTVFHKAMEILANNNNAHVAKLEALNDASEKGFAEVAKEEGIIAFDRYLEEQGLLDDYSNYKTEVEVSYKLYDDNYFLGYIDAVIENEDGTVTLVDYKTYRNAPQESKLRYSLQAQMYMAVMDRIGLKVKGFEYHCINPKLVLKGRSYIFRKISIPFRKETAGIFYDEFVRVVKIINNNPSFGLYIPTDYAPDSYDKLYKIIIGDVEEDLDKFVEENFDKKG